ncbi:MAG: mechanosensitive ion channel family protein [Acidobacteriia bacterium]|nr:mechanosensitive ion channel family protein [Terriglobia bacterium]
MEKVLAALARRPAILLQPLIVFAVTMAVALVVRRLFLRALAAWNARTGSRFGRILGEALAGPTLIWTFILAIHFAVESSELSPKLVGWVATGLLVLWILSFTIVSMRIGGNVVRHVGSQAPGALGVTTLTQNLAQLAILVLGILLMLKAAGANITPILTALGVGGLAVALALQDTLSNLFAGFYVAVAGQVRIGDYIRLNTGEEGYVTDITWRSTAIRALSQNMIIVPNAKLGQAIVTNFYLPDKRIAVSVQVPVAYDSDPDRVEKVLLEVAMEGARDIPGMLAEPAPAVAFDPGFGDFALGFTLNFQVAEFVNQFGARNELRKRILRRFRQEGIRIPYPTRTVHIEASNPSADAAHP